MFFRNLKYCFLILVLYVSIIFGQKKRTKLLHRNNWIVEAQIPDSTFIHWHDNAVSIDSKAGVTLWLKRRLYGHYIVEYDRKVLLDDVHYSRLSDVNQFWAAKAQNDIFPFAKNGTLEAYNDLSLLYMGYGGNSNKTTRLRVYKNGERVLLKEYLTEPYLLKKDTVYHIKTEVQGKNTKVWVNEKLLFDYTFVDDIAAGYFAFRMTWSAQTISNFKITTF